MIIIDGMGGNHLFLFSARLRLALRFFVFWGILWALRWRKDKGSSVQQWMMAGITILDVTFLLAWICFGHMSFADASETTATAYRRRPSFCITDELAVYLRHIGL
jgi:hypothetical protein